jgi:hypothetical protein
MWSFIFALLLVTVRLGASIELASWEVAATNPTTQSLVNPTNTAGILSAGPLFVGSSLLAVNATGWTFTGWSTNANDIGQDAFIGWSVTPIPGQPLQIETVHLYIMTEGGSTVGPVQWQLRMSADSHFDSVMQTVSFTVNQGNSLQSLTINPHIFTPSALYFRAYGYNANSPNAVGGFVSGGGGTTVGVVVEGTPLVTICACAGSNCEGRNQNYPQNICAQILDDTCIFNNPGFAIITSISPSSWQVAQYNDAHCTSLVANFMQPCGNCSSLGMHFKCDGTCPGENASANTLSSMWGALYSWFVKKD